MTNVLRSLLFSALVLMVQTLFAKPESEPGAGEVDQLAEFEMARIITDQSRPQDCLAAVAINRIDGQPQVLPAQGFLIEPGVHTINGLAVLDTTYCSIEADEAQINTAADLEVDFEAGQIYYIGYLHKSPLSDERQLVVWKVEQVIPTDKYF